MSQEAASKAHRPGLKFSPRFWENPLVVSAFRLRFRRGGASVFLGIYAMALGTAGALLMYYQNFLPRPWAVMYLTGILAFQSLISAVGSMFGVQSSLQMEVVQRTWDFQRITGLSPGQLLLGKMIGAAADSYLSILATIPFAVWAWSFGAGTLGEIALIYVSIVTTTILFGALGLLHPLEITPGKDAAGTPMAKNNSRGIAVVVFIFLMQILGQSQSLARNPWLSPPFGMLLPVLPILGLFEGNAWSYGWTLPGVKIPYLILAPIAQLLLAAWLFQIMRRRIVYQHGTTISKLSAYGAILAVDAVLLFSLWGQDLPRIEPVVSVASFWATHTVAGLFVTILSTPSRVAMFSWLWHFRDHPSNTKDYVVGERTENTAAVFVIWILGLVVSLACLTLPVRLSGGTGVDPFGEANQADSEVDEPGRAIMEPETDVVQPEDEIDRLESESDQPDSQNQPIESKVDQAAEGSPDGAPEAAPLRWMTALHIAEARVPLEVWASLVALAIMASFGFLYQFLTLLSGRGGKWAFAALGVLVTLPPQITGYVYQDLLPELSWCLLTISPTAQFAEWLGFHPPSDLRMRPGMIPFIAIYGFGAVLAFALLRRQCQYYYRIIVGKLDKMMVPDELGPAEGAAETASPSGG